MASGHASNFPEIAPEIEIEDYFDATRFLSSKCARKYDEYLGRAIVKEKGICLDKLEERMPDFYGRLVTSRWLCFAAEPIKANHTLVAEFYANATETNFGEGKVTSVRGVQVHFGPTIINALYGLLDADNGVYMACFKELGNQWFVDKLHDGVPPEWFVSHRGIDSHEFTAEAKS